MPGAMPDPGGRVEQQLLIDAPAARVFRAFFDPADLAVWWQASQAVTTAVPTGIYAIQFPTTPYRDDLLGPLGGTLFGTVIDVAVSEAEASFQVADLSWVPPEGPPLQPMTLQVRCVTEGRGCRLSIRQEGEDMSPRWRRYYVVTARAWQLSLSALKRYVEAETTGPAGSPAAPPGN